jgi:hypothetical protein
MPTSPTQTLSAPSTKNRPDIVAVIGSRTFKDQRLLELILDNQRKHYPMTKLVSGGAIGADILAEAWADMRKVPKEIIRPSDPKYAHLPPQARPLARNTDLVKACTRVIAFWDGESTGTLDAMKKATAAGKVVLIVPTTIKEEDQ